MYILRVQRQTHPRRGHRRERGHDTCARVAAEALLSTTRDFPQHSKLETNEALRMRAHCLLSTREFLETRSLN